MAVGALVLVMTAAHRSFACREATTSTTVLPSSFGPGARALIVRSSCPSWAALPDRWIVSLEHAGGVDEMFRSHGRPWPGRVEARGQGAGRRLMIHLEPRSLDGTSGVVDIAIGADGRPVRMIR